MSKQSYYVVPGKRYLETRPMEGKATTPSIKVKDKEIALAIYNAETGDIVYDNARDKYYAVVGCNVRKCETEEMALAWIKNHLKIKNESSRPDIVPDNSPTNCAYCDGSFMKGKVGSGFVLIEEDPELHDRTITEKSWRLPYSTLKNVSGELSAALNAAKMAYSHGCKELTIYHDFNGVSQLVHYVGSKKELVEYSNGMRELQKKMSITFSKVPSHSGDALNDIADKLAKQACR